MLADLSLPAVVALVVSVIATRLGISLAKRLAFLDRPGTQAHKGQEHAVPYGGGIAMAVAMACGLASTAFLPHLAPIGDMPPDHGSYAPICYGALALLAVGLYDDLHPLGAGTKFLLQAVVAAIVVPTAGLGIDSFRAYPVLYYGIAWAWLVLICNAYNLLDHADGLCGSISLVSGLVLFTGGMLSGDPEFARNCLILCATLVGFLVWNLPPARVYMGDAGSLPLGFLIGAGTLSVTFWPSGESGSRLAVLAPVLINAVPLYDTATVIVTRLRLHKPVMLGDRNHISHRLVRLGLSARRSLVTAIVLQAALAMGALQLRSASLWFGLTEIAQCVAVFLLVIFLESTRHDPG
jgi:UDP-GlcNAc:undecaprenyl-phosphate GlcNAc-1-phosphate transferase